MIVARSGGARKYADGDVDLGGLAGRSVAVLGAGAEVQAHVLCLRDCGIDVRLGMTDPTRGGEAEAEGIRVLTTADALAESDVVVLTGETPVTRVALTAGTAVALTSFVAVEGFPRMTGVDLVVVAPQAAAGLMRRRFVDGAGVPGLIAVAEDATGKALEVALSYARALGLTRAGVWETDALEAGRAAALAGEVFGPTGVGALWDAAIEVLVEAGCDPEVAYLSLLRAQGRFSPGAPAPRIPGATPGVDSGPPLWDPVELRRHLAGRLG